MQVNNNYQPSFKSLKFKAIYNPSVEKEVKDILYSKLPKQEVDQFLSTLEKSPIETTLGLADANRFNRLDASVYYRRLGGDEKFDYIEEKRRFNVLGLKPRRFIKNVLASVDSMEKAYRIGKYAK